MSASGTLTQGVKDLPLVLKLSLVLVGSAPMAVALPLPLPAPARAARAASRFAFVGNGFCNDGGSYPYYQNIAKDFKLDCTMGDVDCLRPLCNAACAAAEFDVVTCKPGATDCSAGDTVGCVGTTVEPTDNMRCRLHVPGQVASVGPVTIDGAEWTNTFHHTSSDLQGPIAGVHNMPSYECWRGEPGSKPGHHYLGCGRLDHAACLAEEPLVADTETHEVRCCADSLAPGFKSGWKKAEVDGRTVYGESDQFATGVTSCNHGATHDAAKAFCEGFGGRLCTRAELDPATRGTGCGHDHDMIWTSDTSSWVPPTHAQSFVQTVGTCKGPDGYAFPHLTHCKVNQHKSPTSWPGAGGSWPGSSAADCKQLAVARKAAGAVHMKLYSHQDHHCVLYFPAGVDCRDVGPLPGFYQQWKGGGNPEKRTHLPLIGADGDKGKTCYFDANWPSASPPSPPPMPPSCLAFGKCTSLVDPDNCVDESASAPCERVADSVKFPDFAFPMTTVLRDKLHAAGSDLVSPFVDGDKQLKATAGTCEEVMKRAGIAAPEPLGSDAMWDEFAVVADYRKRRQADNLSPRSDWAKDIMVLPTLFENMSMAEAAEAVRADFPSHWPTALALQFLGSSTSMDWAVVPELTAAEFVNKQVLLAHVIGWAVQTVSPTAFSCKHYYGRARPEELAMEVQGDTGEGVCSSPESARAALNDSGEALESGPDFTAYPTTGGCPKHPSWPAMHSAASSASMYLPVLMDLSPEQERETRRLDYAVATARSIAGVHYPSDNIAGLMLGQQIVSEQLPGLLERLGFEDSYVEQAKAKVKKHKFDWAKWEGLGCHLDDSAAGIDDKCACPGCEA